MHNQLAVIEGLHMQIGVGQALFDTQVNPTKRYFLEKRWKTEGRILGAVMMNPSKAGGVESDNTVNRLIEYAKNNDYAALYVVNVVPHIESNSGEIKASHGQNYDDNKQEESFKFVLNKSDCIFIGWGEKGHSFFRKSLKNNRLKNLYLKNIDKFKAINLEKDAKYPRHPLSRDSKRLNAKTKLDCASNKLKEWIVEK